MAIQHKRLKLITLTIGGTSIEKQVQSWKLDPGVKDGDHKYTFGAPPDGEFIEETDAEASLELKLFSDWRSAGISTFLWNNPNTEADFVLDHHPDDPASHVRFSGKVLIQPAPVGGDARETEMTEITLQAFNVVFEEV